jgi:hypothetical protein
VTRARAAAGVDLSIVINAPPALVMRAFFDSDALSAWWRAKRSITTPRLLGAYVVEWKPTDPPDDLLGRLGGVFRGTVMQVDRARGFFVADAYWLPPDGDPIGPMALDVAWTEGPPLDEDPAFPCPVATHLRIRQTGFEDSPRWRRYYERTSNGWERALRTLKGLLEQ